MARARNLSDQDVREIVSILDGWSGPLSWELLVDAVERRLRARYTRQALHKHSRISDAFVLRKKSLRQNEGAAWRPASSPELQAANGRIARLAAENERLEAENNRMLEQYALWAYNAHKRGLDIKFLSQPLPQVDRARTDRGPRDRRVKLVQKS